jgi:hypothetical protein
MTKSSAARVLPPAVPDGAGRLGYRPALAMLTIQAVPNLSVHMRGMVTVPPALSLSQ